MKNVNLIDYLDKPELVKHEQYGDVRSLFYFPEAPEFMQIVVVFETGDFGAYATTGAYTAYHPSMFILKRKKIIGWRRVVVYADGSFNDAPMFCQTKERFETKYANYKLVGPWEKREIDTDEEETI